MAKMSKEARAEAIKTASDASKKTKTLVVDLVKAGYGIHAIYEKLVKRGAIQ